MTTKPDKLAVRQTRDRQIATPQRENEVDAVNALDAIAAAFTGAPPLEGALIVLTENVPLLTPDTAMYQFKTVLQNLANAAAVATDTAQALRYQADARPRRLRPETGGRLARFEWRPGTLGGRG